MLRSAGPCQPPNRRTTRRLSTSRSRSLVEMWPSHTPGCWRNSGGSVGRSVNSAKRSRSRDHGKLHTEHHQMCGGSRSQGSVTCVRIAFAPLADVASVSAPRSHSSDPSAACCVCVSAMVAERAASPDAFRTGSLRDPGSDPGQLHESRSSRRAFGRALAPPKYPDAGWYSPGRVRGLRTH